MFKTAVFPNFQKRNAVYYAREVCDILKEDAEIYIDRKFESQFSDKEWVNFGDFYKLAENMDIIISIGGDGTILRCAGYMKGCKAELLGINTGNLGFMASLETNQLSALENLKYGRYTATERMMLDIKIMDNQGNEIYSASALNDISLSRNYSKIFSFDVFADRFRIGSYRADGVLFSTPTGSTAYALSAGGPVIEPDLECIEMNLICPHSLFIRPVLFSSGRIIKIKCSDENIKDIYISVDGNEPFFLGENQYVTVRKSDFRIKLIDMKENTFFSSLNKKLIDSVKN